MTKFGDDGHERSSSVIVNSKFNKWGNYVHYVEIILRRNALPCDCLQNQIVSLRNFHHLKEFN